jgi:O-antigen/teichoic acid export membrane protein
MINSAAKWAGAGLAVSHLLRFASGLIVARLVSPEAFGIMATLTSLACGVNLLTDIGFAQKIIQDKRSDDLKFLSAMWTFGVLRGAICSALALALAYGVHWPSIAAIAGSSKSVFENPAFPNMVAAIGLTLFITSAVSPGSILAQRALRLKRVVLIDIFCLLFTLAVTVFFSLYWRDVWGLIIGSVLGVTMRTLCTHLLFTKPRSSLRIDGQLALSLIPYFRWVWASSALSFFSLHSDKLFLSALSSSEQFGFLAVALSLTSAFESVVLMISATLGYPALSAAARDDPSSVRKVYYRLQAQIDFICLAGAGFLFTAGPAIVRLLYDARYVEVGPLLSIAGLGLLASRFDLLQRFALSNDEPKYMARSALIRLVLTVAFVPLAFQYGGMSAAAAAMVFCALLGGLSMATQPKFLARVLHWPSEFKYIWWIPVGAFLGILFSKAVFALTSL